MVSIVKGYLDNGDAEAVVDMLSSSHMFSLLPSRDVLSSMLRVAIWECTEEATVLSAYEYLKKLAGSQRLGAYLPEIIANFSVSGVAPGWPSLTHLMASSSHKAWMILDVLFDIFQADTLKSCKHRQYGASNLLDPDLTQGHLFYAAGLDDSEDGYRGGREAVLGHFLLAPFKKDQGSVELRNLAHDYFELVSPHGYNSGLIVCSCFVV